MPTIYCFFTNLTGELGGKLFFGVRLVSEGLGGLAA
jgi:hypothetical protein